MSIPDTVYRAVLRYFNVCKDRDPEDRPVASSVVFTSFGSYHGRSRERLVSGSVIALYLHSPKMRERIYGLLVAIFIFACSAAEFDIVLVGCLGAATALYVDNLRLNEKYIRSLVYFLIFWATYFIQPSRVQSLVRMTDSDM